MSTTFLVDELLPFSVHDQQEAPAGKPPQYIYTRWRNPTVEQLEQKLCALEGAEGCKAFASGMAASTALLLGRLSAGDHLVASDVNYAGTAELLRSTLPRLGIRVSCVDTSDPQAVFQAIGADTKMVWVETPANPILRLSDIGAIAKLCRELGQELVVDSTFATPMATRPLELGADFVVHSLTKYLCGHGDALGGAVLGRRGPVADLQAEAVVHFGASISPFNAWLIMRGLATLPLRMAAHQAAALEVASFLEQHPRVKQVLYPGLPSHPQHELARRQMRNFGGMIAFQVKGDARAVAERMIKSLQVIHYAVSLGHHRSLIYLIESDAILASSFQLPPGPQLDAYREAAGDALFRLSVGLEDAADLIADLESVL